MSEQQYNPMLGFQVLENLAKANQAALEAIDKSPKLSKQYEEDKAKYAELQMSVDSLLSYLVDQTPMPKRELGRDIVLPNQRVPPSLLRRAGNTNIPRMIKNLRRLQLNQFCLPASRQKFGKDIGFTLRFKDPSYKPTDTEKEDLLRWEVRFAEKFFYPAGDGQPSLVKFAGEGYEDWFDLDDITTMILRNKLGEPIGMQLQDPTTWYYTVNKVRHIPNHFDNDMIFDDNYQELDQEKARFEFIQIVNGEKIIGANRDRINKEHFFTRSDYQNHRRGYSIIEQGLDATAALVNAFSYNQSNYTRNRTPHGIMALSGEGMNGPNTVEKIKKLLWASMTGIADKHRLPIVGLPTGGDAKWVSFDQSPKELEYHTGIIMYAGIIYALSGTSPNESGFPSMKDERKKGGLNEANQDGVWMQSQDNGLKMFLVHLEDVINNIGANGKNVFEEVTGLPIMAEFKGLAAENAKLKAEINKGRLEFNGVTANEMLIEEGKEPQELILAGQNIFDTAFAFNTAFSPFIKANIQAEQQKEQQEAQMKMQSDQQAQHGNPNQQQQETQPQELSEDDKKIIEEYGNPE